MKSISWVCQIRVEISQAAFSRDKWHFLQDATEQVFSGYVTVRIQGKQDSQ